MTSAATDNLSPAAISSLLGAVGDGKVQESAIGEVYPLDWRHPRYFDQEQRNRIAAVMAQVAAILSERFVHFYSRSFDVSAVSISEHFAGDLPHLTNLNESFCLPLGPGTNQPTGLMSVTTPTALCWVTLLLGDSESQGSAGRALSALEQSLLSDLMIALAEAFLSPLRSQKDLKPASQIVQGLADNPFEVTQEISRIVFQVKPSDAADAHEVTFVLPCNMLAPLVGKSIAAPQKLSAEEQSRMLAEHLQEMPVRVSVVLGSSRLNFTEAIALNPDDVLLLDKPVEAPIEVKIGDRSVFWGHPTQCEGRYAVLVAAAPSAGKDTKPAASETPQNPPKQGKKG